MKLEFYDCYEKLFVDAYSSLKRTWKAKLKAMKQCRKQNRDYDKAAHDALHAREDKDVPKLQKSKTFVVATVNLD